MEALETVPASSSIDAVGARIVADPDQLGTILKYKADRGYVAYTIAVFVLRTAVWALASPLVCALAVLPLVFFGMFIAPINHHHQHVNTFRSPWLNRIYEIVLAVQTGVAPYAWVLHHNLGHHRNYLTQPPAQPADESRWKRADGTVMGRLEYSFDLLWNHQFDIVRVGRQHPKYFRAFLWMKLPVWGLLAAGLAWKPVETLCIFILPAFLTLFHTIWVTYEHHAHTPSTSHDDASNNRDNRFFNILTGNLGYHTAHHRRPGLHWSLLPQLHERIRHRIPPEQIDTNFW